jgi:GNAT superfamily N-acetyltransferase
MLRRTDLSTPDAYGLVITPAYLSDLHTLTALFDRSSATSRRERFHGAVRRIPDRYLHDLVCGAPGVIARMARDVKRDPAGDCVIAVATAVPESADRAELAGWVDDEWQRHGIGMRVLRAVHDQLRADGVRSAVAYLEPGSTAANALARSSARALHAPTPTGAVATLDLTHVRSEMRV